MRRYSVVAQGDGFYGMCFFTVFADYEGLIMALLDEPKLAGNEKMITLSYPPDTSVVIMPFDGQAQPEPVVISDTGHSEIDMHILRHLLTHKLRMFPEPPSVGGAPNAYRSPRAEQVSLAQSMFSRKDFEKLRKKYSLNFKNIENYLKKNNER